MIRTWNEIRYAEIPNGDILEDPTNMFIIGDDPVILIDTGSMAGLNAVTHTLEQIGNPVVSAILLTHVHIDHGENTDEIRRLTGAPVRFHERELPELAGSDHTITLDEAIADGEIIEHAGYRLQAVLTPGHAAGHLAFIETTQNYGFAGDLLTGSGSSAVFPPWGDLADYVHSMQRIADLGVNPLLPSHGGLVTNAPEALAHFVRRRMLREKQILELLDGQARTAEEIRDLLYTGLPPDVLNDVTGNVILHLEKLERDTRVRRIECNSGTCFARKT